MSKKDCRSAVLNSANEKPVLRSTGRGEQKGLIEE
jgi:hypothetical protein